MEILPLFSIPVSINKNVNLALEIKDEVINSEYQRRPHASMYCTTNSKLLNEPRFEKLKEYIKNTVDIYAKQVLRIEDNEFQMVTSWAVKHNTNDYAEPHIHTNSLISGVFYVETEQDSGDIVFKNTNTTVFSSTIFPEVKEHNLFNAQEWTINPQQGMLLLFPSTLWHYVKPNLNENDRYVVAFNFFPRGKIGNYISEILV